MARIGRMIYDGIDRLPFILAILQILAILSAVFCCGRFAMNTNHDLQLEKQTADRIGRIGRI